MLDTGLIYLLKVDFHSQANQRSHGTLKEFLYTQRRLKFFYAEFWGSSDYFGDINIISIKVKFEHHTFRK